MGKCKFNDVWLEDPRFKCWLTRTTSEYEARCKICRKDIKLGTMGCKALDTHMKGDKHSRYAASQATTVPMQTFASTTVTKVSTTPASVSPGLSTSAFATFALTATLKAEILWVLQSITRHHSYTSNDDVGAVFRAMFPDSEFAKSFSCGKDKTSYLARIGLASFIKRELMSTVNQDSFVVMFDESMNCTTKGKQLDIHVRYWVMDETGSRVQSRYFGSQYMGHSTAEDLLENFKVSFH